MFINTLAARIDTLAHMCWGKPCGVAQPKSYLTDGLGLDATLEMQKQHRTDMEKVYNHTITTDKGIFKSAVQNVTPFGGGTFSVSGEIRAENGKAVGYFDRVFASSTATVHHNSLHIEPEYQGQGIGSALNAAAEKEYKAQGYDKIELHASMSVGGYAWASAGYNWRDGSIEESTYSQIDNNLANIAHNLSEEEIAHVENLLLDGGTPKQLAEWKSENGKHTGKDLLLGTKWFGVKKI
jgi:GNAT superfamily N-acetyltransferase